MGTLSMNPDHRSGPVCRLLRRVQQCCMVALLHALVKELLAFQKLGMGGKPAEIAFRPQLKAEAAAKKRGMQKGRGDDNGAASDEVANAPLGVAASEDVAVERTRGGEVEDSTPDANGASAPVPAGGSQTRVAGTRKKGRLECVSKDNGEGMYICCGEHSGIFFARAYFSGFCLGGNGRALCVLYGAGYNECGTPMDFLKYAGKGAYKKWKVKGDHMVATREGVTTGDSMPLGDLLRAGEKGREDDRNRVIEEIAALARHQRLQQGLEGAGAWAGVPQGWEVEPLD